MKAVLITGAANGIGLALTQVCLEKSFTVIMTDINKDKLSLEANELINRYPQKVFYYSCDVSKKEEVVQLATFCYDKVKQLDWLFNNAGIIGNLGPVWELTENDIHRVMEVNLYGITNVIRSFIPYLFKQTNQSHIINMASLYALCTGSQMAAYSMSKHAVLALSESLYFDLIRLEKPVNVSVVFPSFTDTSLLSSPSSNFHKQLGHLLSHSRPAIDIAEHIVREVEENKFYILPDKEVKGYCESRTNSIVLQEYPHKNSVEKLMCSLLKRTEV
ncbi:SDR family NAD(P)-dependent oxidoreductase [Legionella waltersii]|uniref:Short chain dehydrogenase n=1 Tax=Legionella waltersii TaxID=66969 RepID=A0A0W1ANK7_9GAMM|nr:SDR family NAD(P)-dependent oxidoreductase [Legionella waltersii]KTD82819.1 short chain dehydrogenase [Legionella waltersii]SNV01544.1 oxidoreductase dehydrogenase, short chain [Legionella waltersii]